MSKQKIYTVIAIYKDNGQRYATTVEADTPEAAEKAAQMGCSLDNGWEYDPEHPPLLVAGVAEGKIKLVDEAGGG